MLKLMKYELRKTWITKVILLVITACAEAAYLIGLYGHQEDTMSIGILLLVLLALFGILIIGIESVVVLHRDMNTRQSYMLFMTPNSCYRILGAKVLECGTSILLTGVFFFALGALDISLLFAREGELSTLWSQIQQILTSFTINGRPLQIDLPNLAAFFFSLVAVWITLIITAYFADVISSSLLNGKKFNGVISFVLFLILDWGITRLCALMTASIQAFTVQQYVSGLIVLAFGGIMYVLTARMMEKYLSV